jgi:hypothetical protein
LKRGPDQNRQSKFREEKKRKGLKSRTEKITHRQALLQFLPEKTEVWSRTVLVRKDLY